MSCLVSQGLKRAVLSGKLGWFGDLSLFFWLEQEISEQSHFIELTYLLAETGG